MPHFVEVPNQRAVYRVTVDDGPLPLQLPEIKDYLRIDSSDDDAILVLMNQAATTSAERLTARDFKVRTYIATFDVLQTGLQLRRNLVDAVTSIMYIPTAGTTHDSTVATTVYQVRVGQWWNVIELLPDQVWPTDISERVQAVEVTFTTKLPDDSAFALIKLALLATIAEMYENRGDCLVKGFDNVAMMAGGKYFSQFTIPRI